MNFENINSINTPIETENTQEQEEQLNEKIEQISLLYANQKFKEVKEKNPDYKFSDALKAHSLSKENILKPIFKLADLRFNNIKDKIDVYLDGFCQEIDDNFNDHGFDLDEVMELISLKKKGIIDYLGLGDLKPYEPENKKSATKIIKFNNVNEIDNVNYGHNLEYKPLLKLGFSNKDQFLEVHFDNFFSNDEKNLGPELIKSDLAVIAEEIIKNRPETAAVIGRSWLLDTPIAQRLGFRKIEDETVRENNATTWSQFINRNGQVDQKRFNKFLESGELPFKSVKAYIPVKEFLSRYLPDNLKGAIILKEIDEAAVLGQEKLEEEMKKMKNFWGDILKTGRFEDIINHPTLNKALSFVSSEDKEKYLAFFKKMFDQKIEDFTDIRDEEIKSIGQRLNENMKKSLYREVKVIID